MGPRSRGSLEGQFTHLDVAALLDKMRTGGPSKKEIHLALRQCLWLQERGVRQTEALKLAADYLASDVPLDSWGHIDKGKDHDRKEVLAAVRAALQP